MITKRGWLFWLFAPVRFAMGCLMVLIAVPLLLAASLAHLIIEPYQALEDWPMFVVVILLPIWLPLGLAIYPDEMRF